MDAASVGIAFSIGSLGALLGAFSANAIAGRLGVGPTIVVFSALSGPALLPLALVPAGTPLPSLVALLAVAGFVLGLATSSTTSTR